MIELKNITAVCYDGRILTPDRRARYELIIRHMNSQVTFSKVKMFLTESLNLPGVEVIRIPSSGISRYNDFCVNDLCTVFSTSHCLVFQDDGFVVDSTLWDDNFQNYDYIGAPWPDYLGWAVNDHKVGNGGFSLRSKRLCDFTRTLPPASSNEDARICSQYRKLVDAAGLRIAPIEVAVKFSVENPFDSNHRFGSAFGYHGNQHEAEASAVLSRLAL